MEARLWRTGWTWAEKFQRNEILSNYRPKLAIGLAGEYLDIAGPVNTTYHVPDPATAAGQRVASTWTDAMAHLRSQHRQLQKAHLSRAFDEAEIRDYADNYSRACAKMTSLERRAEFALSLGVEPPEGRTMTEAGACARMDDAKWWRRQLRRTWTRRAENAMREMGIVRKGREPYATDDAVLHRHGQKVRGRKYLEAHAAVNETGEQLNLLDVVEGSVANPAIRRAEFMTRVRGFEEIADDAGHVAQFWTLTTPSIYHSQLAKGGRNPKYNGATPREAQEWLCQQWARARAKLKRLSILMYGFRIAEPHHDGTPHWHLLVFCRERDAETIYRVIRDYWINGKYVKEHADELGPRDARTGLRPRENARCKMIPIDKGAGSAAGYVAKYVSKNIDGEGEIGGAEDWETGKLVNDGIKRVDAWAALHGIRQFQQIGGPPVGLWRELRRMTEASEDEAVEAVRAAADAGDWKRYTWNLAFEGIRATRKQHNVSLARQTTGERSQYGEEKADGVVGVRGGSHIDVTRKHDWRIVRCGTAQHSSDQPGENTTTSPSETHKARGDTCSDSRVSGARPERTSNLHPFGGLCGLGLGDRRAPCAPKREGLRARYEGLRKKGRAGLQRATQPQRVPSAPSQGRPSGSFSSVFFPPWTRGNNCTQKSRAQIGREAWQWETWVNAWHREHGRYPTLAETIELTTNKPPEGLCGSTSIPKS